MPHTHGAHIPVLHPGVRAAVTQVWIQVGQLDCCVLCAQLWLQGTECGLHGQTHLARRTVAQTTASQVIVLYRGAALLPTYGERQARPRPSELHGAGASYGLPMMTSSRCPADSSAFGNVTLSRGVAATQSRRLLCLSTQGRAMVRLSDTLQVSAPDRLEAEFLYEDTAGYLRAGATMLEAGDIVVDVGTSGAAVRVHCDRRTVIGACVSVCARRSAICVAMASSRIPKLGGQCGLHFQPGRAV